MGVLEEYKMGFSAPLLESGSLDCTEPSRCHRVTKNKIGSSLTRTMAFLDSLHSPTQAVPQLTNVCAYSDSVE